MDSNKDRVRIKGKDITVDSYDICNKPIIIQGNNLKIARLKKEYFDDVDNPQQMLIAFRENNIKADLFTFWQRLPDVEPKYKYHMEYENLAVLEIESYDYWFNRTINPTVRNRVRKAGKMGVIVDIKEYNDELVNGIVDIYNETPIRQGKPFWHYGKGFSRIKEETSDALDKSVFLGAYYNRHLIGFIKLLMAEQYAIVTLILSMVAHRDKPTANALLAKAVEVCCSHNKEYLIYADWNIEESLAFFKKGNGFKPIGLPRYFIPLTTKGRLALQFHLHRGILPLVPKKVKSLLNEVRVRYMIYKTS